MGEIERWLTEFKRRNGLDDEATASGKAAAARKQLMAAFETLREIGEKHEWQTCPRCREEFWVLGKLGLCGNCDPPAPKFKPKPRIEQAAEVLSDLEEQRFP